MTRMVATLLDHSGLADLRTALDAARLPSADLVEPGRIFFRFDEDGRVGYGGFEGHGADRLLRSIVVMVEDRRHGFGRTMVGTLERHAHDLGVRRLHLLTTTSAPFFRALGYADAERGSAPLAIASSSEFVSLCPASAAYLVKAI